MLLIRHIIMKASLGAYRTITEHGTKIVLVILLVTYFFGFAVFSLTEPEGSALRTWQDYTWYFVVSASTVGYGDLSPATPLGKFMGVIIIFAGVGSFGVLLTMFTALASKMSEKVRKGLMNWAMEDHIVILGYHPERTEQIVRQIMSDKNREDSKIVLAFSPMQADDNPMVDDVYAVKGILDSEDVMERTNIAFAKKIIIDVGDDDQAIAVALSVAAHNTKAHVVVGLNNMHEGPTKIGRIPRQKAMESVLWPDYKLLVQAMQDPGTSLLLNVLTCNQTGHQFYRMVMPTAFNGKSFGDAFVVFKQTYQATIVAIAHAVDNKIIENPEWTAELQSGDALFYIAPERIRPDNVCLAN